MFLFGLNVAWQDNGAPISGGQMDVDHTFFVEAGRRKCRIRNKIIPVSRSKKSSFKPVESDPFQIGPHKYLVNAFNAGTLEFFSSPKMAETTSPRTKVDQHNLLPTGAYHRLRHFRLDVASAAGAGKAAAAIPPQE
jgi:hypothetical protein